MKFNKKKILTQVAIATTLLSSAGTAVLGSTVLAHGEETKQVISSNPIADTTSPRSISLWKYQVNDASELGDRGDGSKDETVTKLPIKGIKFNVQRVKPLTGGASLTDPKKQVLGTDYEIDATYAAQELVTDKDGMAKLELGIGKANDGIYLITELADDRTDLTDTDGKKVETPAAPFFVYVPQTKRDDLSSLIYDVQVQPKNILSNLLDPDKTIENSKGHSVQAGKEFEWELAAKIPSGLWQVAATDGEIDVYDEAGKLNGTYTMKKGDPIVIRGTDGLLQPNFSMTDTLDKQLTYKADSAKMQVKKGETGTWEDLAATDFTVDFDAATNTVVTKLTEAGLQKLGTAANGYTHIQTVFITTVAEGWNGIVPNNFTVNYQIPGQEPKSVTPPEEVTPKYYTGGFDIDKKGEDTNKALAGAEFMIAFTEQDARDGKFVADDGKSYLVGSLPTGVSFLKATTDAAGHAAFDGLELGWDPATHDTNGDGIVQAEEVYYDYWVVETVSPEGYELLKEPQKVTVTTTTHDETKIELYVVDKPKTELPFTGGEGTTLLVAIALGAITIGTVAISIDKKRRQA